MWKTLVWKLWDVGASGYLLPSFPLLPPQLSQQLYHFCVISVKFLVISQLHFSHL